MIHVILCGGSGERLWPLSRQSTPKQFINLLHERTLLQRTACGNQAATDGCMIVCNETHSHLVQQQLEQCAVAPKMYLFEPVGRNSAAAICLALLALKPDDIALITPADLYIDYSEAYFASLKEAETLASQGDIVIFGITPQGPETGYGYIELGVDGIVNRFHEKPKLEVAQTYLQQDNFFWNSGMLCAKASVILGKMQKYAPDILEQSQRTLEQANETMDARPMLHLPIEEMRKIPAISIDYALLEKLTDLKMVKGSFEWSDVGSFDAMYKHLKKDTHGNAGSALHITVDSKENLVVGQDRLIATIDVENLVIVDTPDALLVSKMGSTQKVKDVVRQIDDKSSHLKISHVDESRPWGQFTVLESADGWKVKRITVNPGKRLSLQKHMHRSEHWVVVAGTARVTVGECESMLYPNQSIFIPVEEIHRIENPGSTPLIIIEVQCGAYTGEDDIIRYQDDFKRAVVEP